MKYQTALSDFQWSLVSSFVQPAHIGRPPIHSRRLILDAIFYILKTGCHWRMLPKDFPPYTTVYHYFKKWKDSGLWAQLNRFLCRRARRLAGKNPNPSLLIIDSQSIKGTQGKQEQKGVDGFKKVNGRKRHLLVDVLGLIVACVVTAANIHDNKICEYVLEEGLRYGGFPRLQTILADQGYQGNLEFLIPLRWGIDFEVCRSPSPQMQFFPQPKRWIGERTNAWVSASRRNAKDYEVTVSSAQFWVYAANIKIALGKINKGYA